MSAEPEATKRLLKMLAQTEMPDPLDGGAHCAGAGGSVPPLWAIEAACLIINTYLRDCPNQDFDENDVAEIIAQRFLAAQNTSICHREDNKES